MSIMPSSSGGSPTPSQRTGDSTAPNLKKRRLVQWKEEQSSKTVQEKTSNLSTQKMPIENIVGLNKDTVFENNPSLVTDLLCIQEKSNDIEEGSGLQQKRRAKGGVEVWKSRALELTSPENSVQLQDNIQKGRQVSLNNVISRGRKQKIKFEDLAKFIKNKKREDIILEDILGHKEWYNNTIEILALEEEKRRLYNIYKEMKIGNNKEINLSDITLPKGFLTERDWCNYSGAKISLLSEIRKSTMKLSICQALKLAIGYHIRNKYIKDEKINVLTLGEKGWEKLMNTNKIKYSNIKCNLSEFLNIIPIILKNVCSLIPRYHPNASDNKLFITIESKMNQVIQNITSNIKLIPSFNEEKSIINLKDMFHTINIFIWALFSPSKAK